MPFLLIDEIKEASAIDIDFLIPMDETVEKRILDRRIISRSIFVPPFLSLLYSFVLPG